MSQTAETTTKNVGTIVQVIGPVVDVDFSKSGVIPKLYEALEIRYEVNGVQTRLVLEVQQHLGDQWVRSIAMSSTEGLRRGMSVDALGSPITVPVGEGVLGRIFNVTGDPTDERGEVPHTKRYPIHRRSPLHLPRQPLPVRWSMCSVGPWLDESFACIDRRYTPYRDNFL